MIQRNTEAEIYFTVHDFTTLVMQVGYQKMMDEVMNELKQKNYQFTEEEKVAMSKMHDDWEL